MVPEDGDPIPAEQAAIVALVIDQIEPDTDVTAENLHRALAAESTNPPSLRELRTVLDILAMPHVGFTPGESSAAVLKRMRDMLEVWLLCRSVVGPLTAHPTINAPRTDFTVG